VSWILIEKRWSRRLVVPCSRSDKGLRRCGLRRLAGDFTFVGTRGGSATVLGQLAFFANFLGVSGLFARWRDE
jgi:hypothetical protein